MDSVDRAFVRRALALGVLAVAVGVWSGCPGDGGGNDGGQDSGQDSGQDAGSDAGSDAGFDAGSDGGSDAGQPEPSVTAQDQTLDLATDLTVASVTATAQGWVVVTAPLADGGTATGATAVAPGTFSGVHVGVMDPLADGTTVTAELHRDLGTPGTYEPGVDPLVTADGGTPVTAAFHVTVPARTPAVRYTFVPTFGGGGFFIWRVSATPSTFASTLNSTGDNPTLTLFAGWRYEAVDLSFTGHPFQLANSSGTDTVLLSMQAGVGTLKDDPTIDWVDGTTTGGVARFTLSPSLQSQLNLYRCGVHFGTMRAPVTIQSR
ncbi:MAG TPA: hypothetical protein VFA20_11725 [Myxococcaceae bacterium]|nr:hypothetical protein [Myxococcaceae bacterium]